MADGFTVQANDLRLLAKRVCPVVERRITAPILSTVLICWGGGRVSMRGTDLDSEILAISEAETDGSGAVPVQARHIQWLARVASGAVTFTLLLEADKSRQKLTIKTGDISITLNVIYQVEDFPMFQSGDTLSPLSFSQRDLHRLLSMGRCAISTEETRYYLNGVFLHGIRGKARAVSTDGHRMAIIDSDASWWAEGWRREKTMREQSEVEAWIDCGIIVPTNAIRLILNLIDPRANEPVGVRISELRIIITGRDWKIESKLIDGTYPSYERIIPRLEPKASATVSFEALRMLVNSPMNNERSRATKLDLHDCRAITRAPDGDGEVSIPITATGDFEIGFNGRYLVEAARALGGVMRLDLVNPQEPARAYGEDPKAMFILMPMRV